MIEISYEGFVDYPILPWVIVGNKSYLQGVMDQLYAQMMGWA